jgi:hypothetical protein
VRKRRAIWIGAASVLVLAVPLAAVLTLRPSRVTEANCDRIAEGMAEAEVEAIFGRRADARATLQVSLDVPGKPVARQKNWSGRRHVAVVGFSPEGTVVWKSFIELTDESWVDGLARRLGIP